MTTQVEETRARIEREQASAEKEARRTLSSANEQAESILRDARATAERIRLDSERELTAATQRRDSINAQLVNVRQMLATLSGGGSGLVDLPLDVPAEPVAQDAQEQKD
jgi:regulator of protease activity HflC (stomatin/prohibitin superfamily)